MSKTIISDTSCLITLVNINQLELLKQLYDEITITPEVYNEFGETLPHWISIEGVTNSSRIDELKLKLDIGEASSIALALEKKDVLLIIDEAKGRKLATSLGIEIVGTIGILMLARKKGLIKNLNATTELLIQNGFRISEELLKKLNE